MNICLLSNQSYALATLLTAWEVAGLSNTRSITIIKYPDFELPLFNEAIYRISVLKKVRIEVKSLTKCSFINFKGSAHFSEVVLVKFELPRLISHEISIFLDSGYIITNPVKFNNWLLRITGEFLQSEKSLAIHSPPLNKWNHWHTIMRIILFRKSIYTQNNILERIIESYKNPSIKDRLKIPDQDLANLTLKEEDFLRIKELPEFTYDLVNFNGLASKGIYSQEDLSDQYSIFKFTGSIKPWQLWVLNPDKRIFLKKIKALSDGIGIDLYTMNAICLYSQIPLRFSNSAKSIGIEERERQVQYISYNCLLAIEQC